MKEFAALKCIPSPFEELQSQALREKAKIDELQRLKMHLGMSDIKSKLALW